METMNSQIVALVVGLLRAARSDAAFQKILDEPPPPNEPLDQVEYGPGQEAPQADFARPLQGDRSFPQSHDGVARGSTQSESLNLSPRQCEILRLIALGRSNKEIARTTGITPETVKTHVKNIFVKLSVAKRAEAVARAHTLGLVKDQLRGTHSLYRFGAFEILARKYASLKWSKRVPDRAMKSNTGAVAACNDNHRPVLQRALSE